jgi:hypothetical protein
MIHALFNWLRPSVRPLERKLIDALAERLGSDARALLMEQVEQINLVQRHAKDKEVNFYCMRQGKPAFDERFRFPERHETKLATVTFKAANAPKQLRADFWIVNGHLFTIEFKQSPKQLRDIEIENLELFINPMESNERETVKPKDIGALTGWLKEWATQWSMQNLKEPLPKEQRLSLLKQLYVKLPTDYVDLVTQTEGAEINGYRILGLSEIRNLVLPEANYSVLVELGKRGVLGVRQDDQDAQIYFLRYEDERPLAMGTSLRSAVESQLQQPT